MVEAEIRRSDIVLSRLHPHHKRNKLSLLRLDRIHIVVVDPRANRNRVALLPPNQCVRRQFVGRIDRAGDDCAHEINGAPEETICAMILPGISGSFILLILGKYTYIINAIKELDVTTIIVFGIGCVVGLLSFARAVSWLLKRHHDMAISMLAGFMLGSLNKIWPWKAVTAYRIDSHGEQKPFLTENILPTEYFAATGQAPFILQALLFALLGIGIVVILEKVAARNKKVVKSV